MRAVAISPNKQIIATAGKEQNIKLWNIKGELIKIISAHSGAVLDVEFSPDGQKIASSSADDTIKIWDADGKLLTTLRGHSDRVWDVAFSPNSKQLASVSEDKLVKLWDLERNHNLDTLENGCRWIEDYLETNAQVKQDNNDNDICP